MEVEGKVEDFVKLGRLKGWVSEPTGLGVQFREICVYSMSPSASKATRYYDNTAAVPGAGSRHDTAQGRFWSLWSTGGFTVLVLEIWCCFR